ncbi:type II toxin-antitoxin system CcdA family antitoxin [Arcobacter sp. YIC-80]
MITEALTSYLNIASKEEKAERWYKENKEAIDAYNKEVEEGLILKDSRMF